VDLWSSKTTWGGNEPPKAGDSVVITEGQYILLDESLPSLNLLYIEGVLEFSNEVGDLSINASYIFIYGGMLRVGTEEEPFESQAIITLEGGRITSKVSV
jgi:cell migration-inducing and hyaluronan-binding protein